MTSPTSGMTCGEVRRKSVSPFREPALIALRRFNAAQPLQTRAGAEDEQRRRPEKSLSRRCAHLVGVSPMDLLANGDHRILPKVPGLDADGVLRVEGLG